MLRRATLAPVVLAALSLLVVGTDTTVAASGLPHFAMRPPSSPLNMIVIGAVLVAVAVALALWRQLKPPR